MAPTKTRTAWTTRRSLPPACVVANISAVAPVACWAPRVLGTATTERRRRADRARSARAAPPPPRARTHRRRGVGVLSSSYAVRTGVEVTHEDRLMDFENASIRLSKSGMSWHRTKKHEFSGRVRPHGARRYGSKEWVHSDVHRQRAALARARRSSTGESAALRLSVCAARD